MKENKDKSRSIEATDDCVKVRPIEAKSISGYMINKEEYDRMIKEKDAIINKLQQDVIDMNSMINDLLSSINFINRSVGMTCKDVNSRITKVQ